MYQDPSNAFSRHQPNTSAESLSDSIQWFRDDENNGWFWPLNLDPNLHHDNDGSSNGEGLPGQSLTEATGHPFGPDHSSRRRDRHHISQSDKTLGPKIGRRLSLDAVRVLKQWLSAHQGHPYPSETDKSFLQASTGLSMAQITNWFANARRRGKFQPSSHDTARFQDQNDTQRDGSDPVTIPPRRPTPAPTMASPLERWVGSPPESEPASPDDIARALASSSADSTTFDMLGMPDFLKYGDGSSSSLGTSSNASIYSPDSFLSGTSHVRRSRRRRSHDQSKTSRNKGTRLVKHRNIFECTFCTETFKTKYAWQRHENSLHLSLEQWVCAPHGAIEGTEGDSWCAFCGVPDPNDAHIVSHNYDICRSRPLRERTFSRKDHLAQHLRLVHNMTKTDGLHRDLSQWKASSPEIRSTCGFCGMSLQTWEIRAGHLADHFKMGHTMGDWKGDWGFEPDIAARVENSIPPYIIGTERNTPMPFRASATPFESPRNAYELLSLELMHFIDVTYSDTKTFPTSTQIHLDACRIIFTSECNHHESPEPSWLRDLIISDPDIAMEARLRPLRKFAESHFRSNGGVVPVTHHELQQEATRIVQRQEDSSRILCINMTNWMIGMINTTTGWLDSFCERAGVSFSPVPVSIAHVQEPEDNAGATKAIFDQYQNLEERLVDHVEILRAHGVKPDETTLRKKANELIMKSENQEWKEIAIGNEKWFDSFQRRYLKQTEDPTATNAPVSRESAYTQGLERRTGWKGTMSC
ncbi:Homeobox protein-like protein [Colletotrichum karsti]|uniref:Homeobox protein-like protein n=1 Tax=Colletotrichum karsti TaxID=1095194 RepID=A0A9P6HYL8_9PEZI|nr:Homeobox protein-like protein [Colletotrichum karsti]KAF9873243.1 Homeobox protein-like protein [Colletotrichum karsti]